MTTGLDGTRFACLDPDVDLCVGSQGWEKSFAQVLECGGGVCLCSFSCSLSACLRTAWWYSPSTLPNPFLLIPPHKPPTTAHIASLCDPLSVCLTTYIRMLYESQIINPNHDLCPCDMCSYAFGRALRTSAGGQAIGIDVQSRLRSACTCVSRDEIGSRRRQPPPPEDHGSSHGSTLLFRLYPQDSVLSP